MSTLPKPHLLGVLAGLFMASGLIVSTTLLTRSAVTGITQLHEPEHSLSC